MSYKEKHSYVDLSLKQNPISVFSELALALGETWTNSYYFNINYYNT